MYSLLLMSAMVAGPDTASFGWRLGGSCHGCTGVAVSYSSCYGSSCYGSSCYGSSCYGSSCYGSSCYGSSCYGSSCYGVFRSGLFHGGLLARLSARRAFWASSSCYGSSCYGSSCYGSSCYGSCYGSSCYGSSCYGSCYGSSYSTGCHGSCYGSGCHGTGCSGIILDSTPDVVIPPVSYDAVPTEAVPAPVSSNILPKEAATITIDLPADAKLYVDGVETQASGPSREFHTPQLEVGQAFFYDFKAEMMIDGKVEVEEKRVVVRAGMKGTESFSRLLAAAKSAKPTTVAISTK